jgi:Spy/CpxP family protein refolding chaperone
MRPNHCGKVFGLAAVFIVAMCGGLLALSSSPAGAQMIMMMGPDHDALESGPIGGPDMPMFLRSANLRPEQRAQAQRILDGSNPAFARLFAEIHGAKQQLDDQLFSSGVVNPAAVEQSSRRIAQLQAQLGALEVQTALQMRALLAPDQLGRVAEFHQKLENLHQQMRDLMQTNMGPPDVTPTAIAADAAPPPAYGCPPEPAGPRPPLGGPMPGPAGLPPSPFGAPPPGPVSPPPPPG